jgi:hypothetical protein
VGSTKLHEKRVVWGNFCAVSLPKKSQKVALLFFQSMARAARKAPSAATAAAASRSRRRKATTTSSSSSSSSSSSGRDGAGGVGAKNVAVKEEEKEEDVQVLRARLEEQEERFKKRESDFKAQMREKEMELERMRKELVKYAPTPLWKVLTDVQYRDIFEKHMLDELDELSFRVFREVNTESRDAIRRSKRKLLETFEVNICVGDVETVETEKLEGKQMQYHFCSKAADSGNLALLRWLREEKKFEWDDMTINAAAAHGHLHIVKYCMEQKKKKKCPVDFLACVNAAEHGHLDVLKYLHENGAPWDSWTCFFARKNNYLECLVYALDNGCPNDKHQQQQQANNAP